METLGSISFPFFEKKDNEAKSYMCGSVNREREEISIFVLHRKKKAEEEESSLTTIVVCKVKLIIIICIY